MRKKIEVIVKVENFKVCFHSITKAVHSVKSFYEYAFTYKM